MSPTSRTTPSVWDRSSKCCVGVAFAVHIAFCGLTSVFIGCAAESTKQAASDSAQATGQGSGTDADSSSTAGNTRSNDGSDLALATPKWIQKIEKVADGNTPTLQYAEPAGPIRDLLAVKGQLEDLLLDGGGVQDRDVETIAQFGKLIHLRIRLDQLSDSAAESLVGSAKRSPAVETLQILNWPHSTLSSEGIRELAKLKRLRQLRLGGDQLDDEAAKEFAKLPELRSLHVIRPQFTADALKHLAAAPKLTSLYIDDCPLPDEAWESLFVAKPKLHVHIDQAHHDLAPSNHP